MKCSKVNVGRVREDLSKLNKEIKSSDWLITFPDNHTEIITNLKEFSHTHNLSYGCMWQVANKKCGRTQHKGYKVIKV